MITCRKSRVGHMLAVAREAGWVRVRLGRRQRQGEVANEREGQMLRGHVRCDA